MLRFCFLNDSTTFKITKSKYLKTWISLISFQVNETDEIKYKYKHPQLSSWKRKGIYEEQLWT